MRENVGHSYCDRNEFGNSVYTFNITRTTSPTAKLVTKKVTRVGTLNSNFDLLYSIIARLTEKTKSERQFKNIMNDDSFG